MTQHFLEHHDCCHYFSSLQLLRGNSKTECEGQAVTNLQIESMQAWDSGESISKFVSDKSWKRVVANWVQEHLLEKP